MSASSGIGAPGAPWMGIGESPEQTRADQAKGLAEIRAMQAGRHTIALAIKFIPDPEARQFNPQAPEGRIAVAKCPQCGAECRVHQKLNIADSSWSPDAAERLAVFGWVVTEESLAFCGKYCAAAYGVQMRRHGGEPIPPVKAIADQNYARKAYATEAKPADVTTPAVMPANAAAQPGKRGGR